MPRFISIFLIFFVVSSSFGQSIPKSFVPWSKVYKTVFLQGKINDEEKSTSFNFIIEKLGMINPSLIFRYSKNINYGIHYKDEFKIVLAKESIIHNKWLRDEIEACENDSKLSVISKARVRSFLEKWIQTEVNPDLLLRTYLPLSKSDTLSSQFCTYLFYSESLGEKENPEGNYLAITQKIQSQQRAEMNAIIATFEVNRFDQNYQKLERFLYKSLYAIRTTPGGFQNQKTRIYQLIADCNPDVEDGVTSKTFTFIRGFLLRPDKEGALNNQLILGAGFYNDPEAYRVSQSVPLNYLKLIYENQECTWGSSWFVNAGYDYWFNPFKTTFSNLRLEGIFTFRNVTFSTPKILYPLVSVTPGASNYMAVLPTNAKYSGFYINTSILASTHVYEFSIFRFDAGISAGYQSMKIKMNATLEKSLEQYSDSTGELIKVNKFNNPNKIETTKSFGGLSITPLIAIHADIFDYFTLTARATTRYFTVGFEGHYNFSR